MELDYKKIDINQCDGELQFNTFAGSHKCKRDTTTVPDYIWYFSMTQFKRKISEKKLIQNATSKWNKTIFKDIKKHVLCHRDEMKQKFYILIYQINQSIDERTKESMNEWINESISRVAFFNHSKCSISP